MTQPRLIANRWQCPDGTILESTSRHAFIQYIDKSTGEVCFVDGGTDYMRTSGNLKNISVYSDDPHELQREVMKWGSYGKDGKQKLKYILLKDLSTDHIESILLNCTYVEGHIKTLFKNELEYRLTNKLD